MSLEIIEMKVADLVPYAMNAKQHPAEQVAQIAASIEEFGMNDPVAVWHDADGVPIIVEGHGRVLALQKLKRETCPVICLDDLSDTQRRAYTLVHNQLTFNSGWDADKLETELENISNDIQLDNFGFDLPSSTDFDVDSFFKDAPEDDDWDKDKKQEKTVTCPNCGEVIEL